VVRPPEKAKQHWNLPQIPNLREVKVTQEFINRGKMIPDQWYAVLESKQVPTGRPVGVIRMGERLVQADTPIVAFRRRRQELIEIAGSARTG
jgi:hypothetical protein